LRITRYPSISEQQFLGCNAAFVDSLTGELHSTTIALRRLEGRGKGSAFAHEMTLDAHRYGALIVLDRWASVVRAFGPHLQLSRWPEIVGKAPARIGTAEELLGRVNQLVDSGNAYTVEMVEAVLLALQSVANIFEQERSAADQMATLGPMLSEEYKEARQIFLEDLAAR
jgi:hypothetical protein